MGLKIHNVQLYLSLNEQKTPGSPVTGTIICVTEV